MHCILRSSQSGQEHKVFRMKELHGEFAVLNFPEETMLK